MSSGMPADKMLDMSILTTVLNWRMSRYYWPRKGEVKEQVLASVFCGSAELIDRRFNEMLVEGYLGQRYPDYLFITRCGMRRMIEIREIIE